MTSWNAGLETSAPHPIVMIPRAGSGSLTGVLGHAQHSACAIVSAICSCPRQGPIASVFCLSDAMPSVHFQRVFSMSVQAHGLGTCGHSSISCICSPLDLLYGRVLATVPECFAGQVAHLIATLMLSCMTELYACPEAACPCAAHAEMSQFECLSGSSHIFGRHKLHAELQ